MVIISVSCLSYKGHTVRSSVIWPGYILSFVLTALFFLFEFFIGITLGWETIEFILLHSFLSSVAVVVFLAWTFLAIIRASTHVAWDHVLADCLGNSNRLISASTRFAFLAASLRVRLFADWRPSILNNFGAVDLAHLGVCGRWERDGIDFVRSHSKNAENGNADYNLGGGDQLFLLSLFLDHGHFISLAQGVGIKTGLLVVHLNWLMDTQHV